MVPWVLGVGIGGVYIRTTLVHFGRYVQFISWERFGHFVDVDYPKEQPQIRRIASYLSSNLK